MGIRPCSSPRPKILCEKCARLTPPLLHSSRRRCARSWPSSTGRPPTRRCTASPRRRPHPSRRRPATTPELTEMSSGIRWNSMNINATVVPCLLFLEEGGRFLHLSGFIGKLVNSNVGCESSFSVSVVFKPARRPSNQTA